MALCHRSQEKVKQDSDQRWWTATASSTNIIQIYQHNQQRDRRGKTDRREGKDERHEKEGIQQRNSKEMRSSIQIWSSTYFCGRRTHTLNIRNMEKRRKK